MICWTCKEAVRGPVCVGCGAVQPPPPEADPFTLLGIERRFHVDLADVEAKYRALARQIHPDRFTKKSAVERRMALQWTAHVNEARRVLRDELLRARFLATGKAGVGETGPRLDPAFLEEMFEWREADEETPGTMAARATERAARRRAELDSMFTEWEAGRGDLSLVDDRLARLKYVAGLAPKEEHGQHRH